MTKEEYLASKHSSSSKDTGGLKNRLMDSNRSKGQVDAAQSSKNSEINMLKVRNMVKALKH